MAETNLARDYQLGALTTEAYLAAVSGASRGFYSPLDVERVLYSWSQAQIDGAERIFDTLDAAGVDVAVLSNTNEAHWRRLAALHEGEAEYPIVLRAKYRFASHLLGVSKPDLRAYAAVTEAVGVSAARVLFFDDVEENVFGAQTFGWNAEHINPTRDTPPQILAALQRFGLA